jgi:hypothetical protein
LEDTRLVAGLTLEASLILTSKTNLKALDRSGLS